jgi:hypothetical protein
VIPPADNRQAAEAAGAATLAELARRLAAHYGDALRVIRGPGRRCRRAGWRGA